MRPKSWTLITLVAIMMMTCGQQEKNEVKTTAMDVMNEVSEQYVKLVLALGQHDSDYVDAYYGPEEWKTEAEAHKRTIADIEQSAAELAEKLAANPPEGLDEMGRLRHVYLTKNLEAMQCRAAYLGGQPITFTEETARIYDVSPPQYGADHFQALLDELDAMLPGEGPLNERLTDFRKDFVIPTDKLDTVFRAAIDEARKRTSAHMKLPEGESFVVEYVTDKPWSGYNWFKGKAHSLIQVNTEFPIYIDRALDLACHEGYPGHHVYNALLEQHLVNERGWLEFSVYPLFSPQSLIAEGSANYGIQVAFPPADRIAYEREVLFPLADLDPTRVEEYYKILGLAGQISYAGNEAARGLLDGTMSRDEAKAWLVKYGLMPEDRAAQRLKFIDAYRGYVINYNLGQDMVKAYVERNGGTEDKPERRWEVFTELLSSPMLPSALKAN